jgi:hypothetical protein
MDLKTISDEELETLRTDVLNEQERRQRLLSTPALIAELVSRYEADGGDKSDLTI